VFAFNDPKRSSVDDADAVRYVYVDGNVGKEQEVVKHRSE
jgi:hypothetical protein